MKTLLVFALAFWMLAAVAGQPKVAPPARPAPSPLSGATAMAAQHQTATQQQAATATQTQSVASTQSQQASNAGNQQVTRYEYERQVASAYAPAIAPSAVCATARSGGVSTAVFGVTGGTSGIDLQCDIRETARLFGELGYKETAALIACTSEAAVRAFNGRPCPIRGEAVGAAEEQRVTVTLDVPALEREQRAADRGFVPTQFGVPGK